MKLTLDWDDQLRDNGEDLWATLFEHVTHSLDGEETVGIILFTNTFEENGKVMMVVELRDINFPVDLVLGSMLNCNGQVSTIVESAEFTGRDDALSSGTSFGS